ncbi:hypothetical protein I307_03967 [Cryptococcus deuterogattii 99/473]|uniref:Unplaced genomic scaffold supercont1.5, whole genome shotgun sequence n=1 Tax=Cryptococcus deuterogattii Ram5 TaxID=1296110 RepID=A0A0D0V9D6_9TREE|nr:hypothetical protein I309_01711 [Cryptococcus deuterogattii LA55]KIR41420.1 hypothetical protein I313_02547 [Cryptococcus deuterogattii Ram5]KIR71662.1 hypothetical protein I310_04338 [Cryptococcus deuterogattii CA1014]KIR91245.1 hypothetical protein I304_04712 [Cryptococcus deuterogattii CBS 10090]KIR98566.1 hypothetical protein L804_04142 [Cryptococcus deuterogattii 2001/935-1]KIY56506.1 hypothetical protein I307_03967 [Cryptococcus deuterogattii 99/473]
MPKLKAALAAQQHSAAKLAAKKRAQAAEDAKRASIKASIDGVKKGKKRAKATASKTASEVKPEILEQAAKSKCKAKPPTIPFDKQDTILLLGEANFSFSLSLIREPHNLPAHQILATVYDSEKVTLEKYPDAAENIRLLKEKGVQVEFGVDAGALEKCKAVGKGRRWSRVIFNFPHVDRNILTNQHMLLKFFRSVEPLLTEGPTHMPIPQRSSSKRNGKDKQKGKQKKPSSDDEVAPGVEEEEEEDFFFNDDPTFTNPKIIAPTEFTPPKRAGTVLITLLSCPPYTLWCLPQLAARPPPICPGTNLPQPRYTLLRSFEFRPEIYEGYAHRRTIGWKEGLSKSENEEILGRKGIPRTYEFVRTTNMKDD